jgi:glycosyltransferase involved in cell wall biosynthesis
VQLARQKGWKVVFNELLTGLGSRSTGARHLQGWITRAGSRVLPREFRARLAWDSYQQAEACIALTAWEASLMRDIFGARADRVHVVPNGVEEVFRCGEPVPRGPWLVCTATITERKRVVELADAAVAAQTPVWVIGRPYAEDDAYGKRFIELARRNPQWLRYEGAIHDRQQLARIYREARGFVLLSNMESLSLSALEGAACGCSLLLSDLPWARTTFGSAARYCPVSGTATTARVLREFYDTAGETPVPAAVVKSWAEIAEQLARLYATVLGA